MSALKTEVEAKFASTFYSFTAPQTPMNIRVTRAGVVKLKQIVLFISLKYKVPAFRTSIL